MNLKCKQCAQEKPRLRVGQYKSKLSPKYVDDKGKLWNGRVCPTCKQTNDRNHKRQLRIKRA